MEITLRFHFFLEYLLAQMTSISQKITLILFRPIRNSFELHLQCRLAYWDAPLAKSLLPSVSLIAYRINLRDCSPNVGCWYTRFF